MMLHLLSMHALKYTRTSKFYGGFHMHVVDFLGLLSIDLLFVGLEIR